MGEDIAKAHFLKAWSCVASLLLSCWQCSEHLIPFFSRGLLLLAGPAPCLLDTTLPHGLPVAQGLHCSWVLLPQELSQSSMGFQGYSPGTLGAEDEAQPCRGSE